MNTIPFQPMMESRPIREIAYEVLKHAIITGTQPRVPVFLAHFHITIAIYCNFKRFP